MARILVVGDLILDKTTKVEVLGVCQENHNALKLKPIGIQNISQGGAGNIARGLENLKHDVVFFSQTVSQASVKTRYMSEHGLCMRLDEDRYVRMTRNECVEKVYDITRAVTRVPEIEAVVIVDYGKGFVSGLQSYANNSGGDFGDSHLGHTLSNYLSKTVPVFTTGPLCRAEPNEMTVIGVGNAGNYWRKNGCDREAALVELQEALGPWDDSQLDAVIGTFGEYGSAFKLGANVSDMERAERVPAFDPCGAGDAFLVGVIHEYLTGTRELTEDQLRACLTVGNICGRAAVMRAGVQAVQYEDIHNADYD